MLSPASHIFATPIRVEEKWLMHYQPQGKKPGGIIIIIISKPLDRVLLITY